jgi:hypothetical protein
VEVQAVDDIIDRVNKQRNSRSYRCKNKDTHIKQAHQVRKYCYGDGGVNQIKSTGRDWMTRMEASHAKILYNSIFKCADMPENRIETGQFCMIPSLRPTHQHAVDA